MWGLHAIFEGPKINVVGVNTFNLYAVAESVLGKSCQGSFTKVHFPCVCNCNFTKRDNKNKIYSSIFCMKTWNVGVLVSYDIFVSFIVKS